MRFLLGGNRWEETAADARQRATDVVLKQDDDDDHRRTAELLEDDPHCDEVEVVGREIGYDEHATDGAKPENFVDGAGEVLSETRLDTLTRASHDRKARGSLTKQEIAEVESALGVSSSDSDVIAEKLQMLTDLHDDGDLSDEVYIKKVAALTGKAGPESSPEPPAKAAAPADKQPVAMMKTLCGEEAKGKRGKRMHEMNCNKCKAARGEGDTT